jgi:hypothetical protein
MDVLFDEELQFLDMPLPRDAQRAGIERNVFLSSYVHP